MIDDINKVRSEAVPLRQVEEYVGPMFKTVLKNASGGDIMVEDDRGGNWFRLPEGREITLSSWSNRTMYSPFSKVIFEKNGKVSVTRRFGFKDPVEDAPYSIVLDNRDGGPQEVVRIEDEYVSALRGIPRRVPISLVDSRIGYKAIIWRKRVIKETIPGQRDYLQTRTIVERVLVPRRAHELRAIRRELEKRAVEDARQTADRQFKRITPVEGADDAEAESKTD